MAKRLTKKQVAHKQMIDLALEVYGKSLLFAGFCVAYNYDSVTYKFILHKIYKLQQEKELKDEKANRS